LFPFLSASPLRFPTYDNKRFLRIRTFFFFSQGIFLIPPAWWTKGVVEGFFFLPFLFLQCDHLLLPLLLADAQTERPARISRCACLPFFFFFFLPFSGFFSFLQHLYQSEAKLAAIMVFLFFFFPFFLSFFFSPPRTTRQGRLAELGTPGALSFFFSFFSFPPLHPTFPFSAFPPRIPQK